MIVAGIGCRPGCGAAEVASLLARATALSGCAPQRLAAPWFRADEPCLMQQIGQGLALLILPRAALLAVQPACPTRSARVFAATGIASVAEACALAAAGRNARLLLPRIASANATCALASGDGPS